MYPPQSSPGTMYHPSLGQVRYQATEVSSDPDTQVAEVIGLMDNYVSADCQSDRIKEDATRARITGDPITDTWRYLNRWDGSRGMRFVRDEETAAPYENGQVHAMLDRWNPVVEALIRPVDQIALAQPQGDCDDFAMYGAAHLTALGVPCAFVTVAADSRQPNVYSHVYLVAYPKDGPYAGYRVPIDLSHGPALGWETSNRFGKLREWPVCGSSRARMFLMAGLAIAGSIFLYRSLKGVN